MLNNWEVLAYLFRQVAPEKILFATDTPIALAPGKSVEINNQYTYIAPAPWRLAIVDTEHRLRYTSFLYEKLRAIQKAVSATGLSNRFVRQIFWENGMRLLHGSDIEGAEAALRSAVRHGPCRIALLSTGEPGERPLE